MTFPCPACHCTHDPGAAVHRIVAALAVDDLDQALDAGLLDGQSCPGCSDACVAMFLAARDARLRALAARERHRSREARLQRRAQERAATRAGSPTTTADTATPARPGLPSAAAAALERAKARAAERRKP